MSVGAPAGILETALIYVLTQALVSNPRPTGPLQVPL